MRYPTRSSSGSPLTFDGGVSHCREATLLPNSCAGFTVIENGAVTTLWVASATVIDMDSYTPSSVGPGVPLMRPLVESRLAQGGRLTAVNRSVSLSGSCVTG